MSIKKEIHLAISNYLLDTLKGMESLPDLQWVDKDMGQLNWIDDIVFPRPAILIGFGRTSWENVSKGLQQGTSTIIFKVILDNYADSFTGSPNQELALQFFEFNQMVHDALQGLEGSNFTPLMRTADEEDEEHANFIVSVLEYSTMITDTTFAPERKLVDAEAETSVRKVESVDRPKAISAFVIDKDED